MVDTHHFLWFSFVMASLKAFLYGLAPILGITGAALYERQRALTNLGILEATPGRGPGSGVPLTAENVAAVVISVLAAETLSEIDEDVAALCNAPPDLRRKEGGRGKHKTSFKAELGRVLSGLPLTLGEGAGFISGVNVTRSWKGQIVSGLPTTVFPELGRDPEVEVFEFFSEGKSKPSRGVTSPIRVTAELDSLTLERLTTFTQGALTQLAEEDDE